MIHNPVRIFILSGFLFPAVLVLFSCSQKTKPTAISQSPAPTAPAEMNAAGAPCIVYKTRTDYSKNIPVKLSEDRARIVSYPDVRDIYTAGTLAYPTALSQGYLLDNRGIDAGVAFLKLTYDDYRAMDETPSSASLFDQLLDPDPLVEMYQCGYRNDYRDIVPELNQLITSGKLSGCKKLK